MPLSFFLVTLVAFFERSSCGLPTSPHGRLMISCYYLWLSVYSYEIVMSAKAFYGPQIAWGPHRGVVEYMDEQSVAG